MLVAAAFTVIANGAIAAAPVARAGEAFLAYPGEIVTLNGSASSDADGDPLDYTWRQVGGPEVDLTENDGPAPKFTPDVGGTYSFQLVVSDATQNSPADRVDVVVVEPAVGERLDTGGCSTAPLGGLGLAGLLLAAAAAVRRRS
jgi:hypothetical protein